MKQSIEPLCAAVKSIEKQCDAIFVQTQQPVLPPSFLFSILFCPLLFLLLASPSPFLFFFLPSFLSSSLPLFSLRRLWFLVVQSVFFIKLCDGAFGKQLPRALWSLTAWQQVLELGLRAWKMRYNNPVFFAWTVEQQGTVELMPEPYFKGLIHGEKSDQLLF